MVLANEQWNLWDHVARERSLRHDRENAVGPFRLYPEDNIIPRHMDCVNYEACLSFASKQRWDSFSCEGCRKTTHGRFVEDKRLKGATSK